MLDELEVASVRNEKLEALFAVVRESSRLYEDAKRAEEAARKECCDALNTLNAAQRRVDIALAELRKIAPFDSDWHRVGRG